MNLPAVWEIWVQSLGWEDSLEEGMETYSSILAWRIPMDKGAWRTAVHGFQRIRHHWVTKHSTAHTAFYSGYTSVHSHQQCQTVPFSPHLLQHLSLVDFFMMAILTIIVRWYLITLSIWVSLIISGIEHVFRCFSAICMSSCYSYGHHITIYNSQDIEETQMSINRWMNREDVVLIYNGILLNHKKGQNWINWIIGSGGVNGPRVYHTE